MEKLGFPLIVYVHGADEIEKIMKDEAKKNTNIFCIKNLMLDRGLIEGN